MSVAVEKVLQMLPDPHIIIPSLKTPYSKYRDRCYVAQGEDILAIREIISQRQQHLDDINTIITRVEHLLDQLLKKRVKIISSKAMHTAFISSGIRRLPSDVLGEIFERCIPDVIHVRADMKTAPLVLTRICRRWRDIALDTPRLWRSLSMSPGRIGLEQDLPFYRQWLSNARGLPLLLEVNPSHNLGESRDALIEFVRHYTSRCMELRIDVLQATGLGLLLMDVPKLKQLTLSGDINAVRNTEGITIVQPQPHLRTLSIASVAFHADILSIFNPGWTNLTHLSVALEVNWEDMDDGLFLSLLEACPNLEFLTFTPFYFQNNDPVSITHHKLRSLLISEPYAGGSLLDTLMLPSLRNLQLVPRRDSQVMPFDGTRTILDEDMAVMGHSQKISTVPSHARIYNIFIHEHFTSAAHAASVLTSFNPGWTNLTHLKMKLIHNEYIFSTLLGLCPNLEDFTCYGLTIMGSPPVVSTHTKLHSLTVGILFDLERKFLGTVTLSNLRYLSLYFYRNARWPRREFQTFLSRSRCPLETLDIYGIRDFEAKEQGEVAMLVPTLNIYDTPIAHNWTG